MVELLLGNILQVELLVARACASHHRHAGLRHSQRLRDHAAHLGVRLPAFGSRRDPYLKLARTPSSDTGARSFRRHMNGEPGHEWLVDLLDVVVALALAERVEGGDPELVRLHQFDIRIDLR